MRVLHELFEGQVPLQVSAAYHGAKDQKGKKGNGKGKEKDKSKENPSASPVHFHGSMLEME